MCVCDGGTVFGWGWGTPLLQSSRLIGAVFPEGAVTVFVLLGQQLPLWEERSGESQLKTTASPSHRLLHLTHL